MVGLGNVDNTSDANKPVSSATQTALDAKADLASPTFTGTVSGITKSMVGLLNVDNTSDANKPVSTATQTALDLKANLESPTFSGTVSGITKSMVGLSNVDNTSDVNKPISYSTQSALNAKADLASPTFTGTVSGITKSMVGLGNVDNTSDANKPVSSATQTALDAKANLVSPTFTGVPLAPTAGSGTNTTQLATTAFVRNEISSLVSSAPAALDTLQELAAAINSDASFATTVSTQIGLRSNIASPTFTGTVTIPNANITQKLSVDGDASMNNNLDLSGSMIARNNINVYGVINQYTASLEQGYMVNYSQNNVLGFQIGNDENQANTLLGLNSGSLITSGSNNTCLGYNTGSNIISGSNNTCIGNNANPSSDSVSNEITLGNNSVTTLRCQASTITSLSDIRDKKNIQPIPTGLEFIERLNPVKFTWNTRDGSKTDIEEFGFIAQELKQTQESIGITVPNLVNDTNPDKLEASYGSLIPVLVKAIQDLKELTAKQQSEIDALKSLLSV
jgi:hypothetical protein